MQEHHYFNTIFVGHYLASEFEIVEELFPEPGEGITLDLMWSASLFELTPKK